MSSDVRVAKISEKVTNFWLDAAQRWDDVRDKIKSNQTYSADQLTTDIAAVWVNAADLWLGMIPTIGEPVLPSALLHFNAGIASAQSVVVDLATPVPVGPILTSTRLGLVGGNVEIPDTAVTVSRESELELKVEVKFPGGNDKGLYLGAALADDRQLAVIMAVVA